MEDFFHNMLSKVLPSVKPTPREPSIPATPALAHMLFGPYNTRSMNSHKVQPRGVFDTPSSWTTRPLVAAGTGRGQGNVLRAVVGLNLGTRSFAKKRKAESSDASPMHPTPKGKESYGQLTRRPTAEQLQLVPRFKSVPLKIILDALLARRYIGPAFLGFIGYQHLLQTMYIRRIRTSNASLPLLEPNPKKKVGHSSDSSSESSSDSIDSTCDCKNLAPANIGEAQNGIEELSDAPQTIIIPRAEIIRRSGPRQIEFRPVMQLDSLTAGLDGPTHGFCKGTESLVVAPEKSSTHYTVINGDGKARCPVDDCDASSECQCYIQETWHSTVDPFIDGSRPAHSGIPKKHLNHVFVKVKGPAALVLQPQYNKIKFLGQSLPMVTTISSLKRKAANQAAIEGKNDHSGILTEITNKIRKEHLYEIDISQYFHTPVTVYSTAPITVAKVDYRVEHLMEMHAECDLLEIQKDWRQCLPMVPAAERHKWDLGRVIEQVRLTNVVSRPFDLFLRRTGVKPEIFEADAPYITIFGFTRAPQSTEMIKGREFELGLGVDPIHFHAAIEYWDEDLDAVINAGWTPARLKQDYEYKPEVGYLYPQHIAPWEKLKKGRDSVLLPDGEVGTELVRDIVPDYLTLRRKEPNFELLPKEAGYLSEIDFTHCNGQGQDFCPHCNFYDLDECYCPQLGFALNTGNCAFCYDYKKWNTESNRASWVGKWIEGVETVRINGKWMGMDGGMDIKLLRESARDMKEFPQLGLSKYPGFAPRWKEEISPVDPVPGYPPRFYSHVPIEVTPRDEGSEDEIKHFYLDLLDRPKLRIRPAAGIIDIYTPQRRIFQNPTEEERERCYIEADLTGMGFNCVLHLTYNVDDVLLDFTIPEMLETDNLPYNSNAKVYAKAHYREYEAANPFASKFKQNLGELRIVPLITAGGSDDESTDKSDDEDSDEEPNDESDNEGLDEESGGEESDEEESEEEESDGESEYYDMPELIIRDTFAEELNLDMLFEAGGDLVTDWSFSI